MQIDNGGNKRKQLLIIITCILLILGCIIFVFMAIAKSKIEEKPRYNYSNVISQEVLKDYKVGNVTIKNVEIKAINGVSSFMAIVENNQKTPAHFNHLYIVLWLDSGIEKISTIEDVTLSENETKEIKVTFDRDISNVSKIEYVID